MLPKRCQYAVGFEALSNQEAIELLEFGVGNLVAAAEPPGQRGFEKSLIIGSGENGFDRTTSRGRRYSGLFDLSSDTQLPAAADGRFGMSDRFGNTLIVDRPLGAQPLDCILHGVPLVPLAGKSLPNLRFGQLASAQHAETVDVGADFRLQAPGVRLQAPHFCTQKRWLNSSLAACGIG